MSRAWYGAFVLMLGTMSAAPADVPFLNSAPVLDVQSPTLMPALETKGFGLAALLGGDGGPTLRALYDKSRAYRTLADGIASDVKALREDTKANGRTLHEVTDQNIGRIIDLRWLQSPLASFRLVGVVNRIDRKDFSDPEGEASCGEVRFIYRLAYRFKRGTTAYASRLPVNLNVVFRAKPQGDPSLLLAHLFPVPDADRRSSRSGAWNSLSGVTAFRAPMDGP